VTHETGNIVRAVAAALALAGCGGSSGSDPEASVTTAAEPTLTARSKCQEWLAAKPAARSDVVEDIFTDLDRQGAIAVAGSMKSLCLKPGTELDLISARELAELTGQIRR
jgi:hypothetical protein